VAQLIEALIEAARCGRLRAGGGVRCLSLEVHSLFWGVKKAPRARHTPARVRARSETAGLLARTQQAARGACCRAQGVAGMGSGRRPRGDGGELWNVA
jgi:hypothetical protein